MKTRTTAKAIRQTYGPKLAIDYCGAQYLLRNHQPIAYTCGTYGWNFDVYSVNGITICTGYRGMVGKHPKYELLAEYERLAQFTWEDRSLSYEERSSIVEQFLADFLQRAV